jgi:superfamily II DNA or RNA helicase
MTVKFSELQLDYDHVHIYAYDNINVIVASLNPEYILEIKSHFTIKKHNYQFTPAYKSGNWDGNIRFIWKNGLMPKGLLTECIQVLKDKNIPVKVDKKLLSNTIQIDDFQEVTEELLSKQPKRLDPYPYQWEVAKTIVCNERGVARAATSAGKTYITAIALNYLFKKQQVKKVLIVVPSIMLVVQMKENFVEEYGIPKSMVGMYMGSEKDCEPPIVVGTWQSIQNIEDNKFFEQFDMVVVDETHKIGKGSVSKKKDRTLTSGNEIKKILDKCVNANRRIGVTGTMPTDEVDCKTIVGCLGPILIEVTAKELMDKGHISQLQIVIAMLQYDKNIIKDRLAHIKSVITDEWRNRKGELMDSDMKLINYHTEKTFLETYIPKFKYINTIVQKRMNKDENVLILVHSVEYGLNLKKVLSKKLKDVTFVEHICGDVKLDFREECIKTMEKNKRCVIIATMSIFGTGVSIKNLHTVIFASTTKAKISVLQSIGRSLRLHESKDCATVIDIVDDMKYAQQHATERIGYYEEEGFDLKFVDVQI